MNIAAMKTVIDRIETLEAELAAARTELRALVDGDEDAPIPLVPTARGKRKPRPAPTPATRPSRRVAPEALEAVREALRGGPVPASVVASATELRHPTVLAALARLVADGAAVKTGSRRGARWGLAGDDADLDVIDTDGEELED